MSQPVEQILKSFDSLTWAEKHEAAVEIIRRYSSVDVSVLPDRALTEAADELFCAMDAEEAARRR